MEDVTKKNSSEYKQGKLRSNEIEKKKYPLAIGGWLILPLIGLCLTPFLTLYEFFVMFDDLRSIDMEYLREYFPDLLKLIYIESFIALILLGYNIFLMYKISFKEKKFPKQYISFQIFLVFWFILDIFWYHSIFPLEPLLIEDDYIELLRIIIILVIWVPYFLKSERVKNTFIN